MNVRWLLLLLLCSGAPLGAVGLEPVPPPNLDGMEPEVQAALQDAWADLHRQLQEPVGTESSETRGRLAATFGDTGLLYHGFRLEDSAAICYRNASRLAPDEPKWLYLSAILAQGHRDLPTAEDLYRRVLSLSADHVPSILRLAEVNRLQGRFDEAEFQFLRVLEAAALEEPVLEDAVLGDPVPGARAYALWGLGRIANARSSPSQAVERLEAAVELQPEANAVHHALALAYRRLGEVQKASEATAAAGPIRVRFEDPWAELVRPAEGATAQLLLGNAQLRAGRPDSALAYHRRARRLSPEDAAAARALALTLEELGQMPEALELYAEAGRLAESNPLYLYDWARAALKVGKGPEVVIEQLDRVLALAPDFLNAHLLLATCRTQLGQVSAAMENLQSALELSPGEPRASAALAGLWARRAQESLSAGNPEATIQALAKAVELAPREPSLRLDLSRVLMSEGLFKRAVDHLETILKLAPAQDSTGGATSEARLRLVEALLFAGRPDEAAPILLAELDQRGPHVAVLTLAAQLLSVGPEAWRDEVRAVKLAQQGFETQSTPEGAETLALAMAAAGDFETAIQWQERLLDQMRALQVDPPSLRRLERNLDRYRKAQRGEAPWQGRDAGRVQSEP